MFKTELISELSKSRAINNDILFIINSLITLGVSLNLKEGPWIGGGALTKCFSNQPIGDSDIDIFFPNSKKTIALYKNILTNNGYTLLKSSKMADSFTKDETIIQIITLPFKSAGDLLGSFDFTIVQALTDGESLFYYQDFFKDIDKKVLRINFPYRIKNNLTARTIKYLNRGYSISEETMCQILFNNKLVTKKDFYR